MKARNNKELKETTELNKLNEPNDYMNPHMTTTDIRAAIYAPQKSCI